MGQHGSNIHSTAIVVNGGDQTRLVPTNVEHGQLADAIGRGKRGSDLGERCEILSLHLSISVLKGTRRLRMLRRKVVQSLARDYVHSAAP